MTNDPIPHRGPEELVFLRLRTPQTHPLLWLAGGFVAFAFAALGFLAAQFSRGDEISLHFQTTLPATLGIGAFFTAWMMARAPLEVGIGPSGLRITSRRESRLHLWSQIGWSKIQTGPLDHRRYLLIYDLEGRKVAALSEALAGFDTLAEQIAGHLGSWGDGTAQRIQLAKARKSAVFVAVVSVVFIAVSAFVALETRDTIRAQRRLQESAVPGEARIEERHLAPNGITPRLVYRITTPGGRSARRNAELERPVWDQLAGATTVPVLYVPDEPEISRLATGEVEDRSLFDRPLVGYGLPALLTGMSLFFLAVAALQWRGLDLDLDSKTGRLSIKRFGSGR